MGTRRGNYGGPRFDYGDFTGKEEGVDPIIVGNLNDTKYDYLLRAGIAPGELNDMYLEWLQFKGATADQINDAEDEYLTLNGFPGENLNDQWFAYLGSLGFIGTLNQRFIQFWSQPVT